MSKPVIEFEIRQLPELAQVAFGARCVRYVQPLYTILCPEGLHAPVEFLEELMSIAEGGPMPNRDGLWRYHLDENGRGWCPREQLGARIDALRPKCSHRAGVEVWNAVRAAAMASVSTGKDRVTEIRKTIRYTFQAVEIAWRSETLISSECQEKLMAALQVDMERLREAARHEGWADDTPVSFDFFGPLWPTGAPKGWPIKTETSKGAELVIELEAPEGATKEEILAQVRELADRADDLHRAQGGGGLKVKDVEIYGRSPVPAGVPA